MTNPRTFCMILYALYAASAVLQFFEATLLAGLFILTIAYILNTSKNRKAAAKGTPFESHLQWMHRTFWIGSCVIVPLAFIAGTLLVLLITNIHALTAALHSGDPDALMSAISGYLAQNMTKVSVITSAVMVPTIVWWVKRCWTGYELAKIGEPVANVKTWFC